MNAITPCLWFDTQAEEAAAFYTSIFDNSRIVNVTRYSEGGRQPAGSLMTVTFELDGQRFTGLNGGPHLAFDSAISFQVSCHSQEQVDYYWSKLADGGEEGPCGWLKDRYGLSWQIVPTRLTKLLSDPDGETAQSAMRAMLQLKKIDIAALEQAVGAPA